MQYDIMNLIKIEINMNSFNDIHSYRIAAILKGKSLGHLYGITEVLYLLKCGPNSSLMQLATKHFTSLSYIHSFLFIYSLFSFSSLFFPLTLNSLSLFSFVHHLLFLTPVNFYFSSFVYSLHLIFLSLHLSDWNLCIITWSVHYWII